MTGCYLFKEDYYEYDYMCLTLNSWVRKKLFHKNTIILIFGKGNHYQYNHFDDFFEILNVVDGKSSMIMSDEFRYMLKYCLIKLD